MKGTGTVYSCWKDGVGNAAERQAANAAFAVKSSEGRRILESKAGRVRYNDAFEGIDVQYTAISDAGL